MSTKSKRKSKTGKEGSRWQSFLRVWGRAANLIKLLVYSVMCIGLVVGSVIAANRGAGIAVLAISGVVALWVGYYAWHALQWQMPKYLWRVYRPQLLGEQHITLEALSNKVNRGSFFVKEDVKVLIDRGLLPGARLEQQIGAVALVLTRKLRDENGEEVVDEEKNE